MKAHQLLPTLILTGLATPLFNGCVTVPSPEGQTYSATYIGDRVSFALDELVLTVDLPQKTGDAELKNLHVRLDAVVNPKDLSIGSIYEVTDIIRRLEPRMRARVAELVPVGTRVSLQSLTDLKSDIAREAHSTFIASYSKWTKAPAFDVQIVVASFHLTDLSVGAPARIRSWW